MALVELDADVDDWQYFTTYTGVQLPLRLVTPIETSALSNRNTFFRAKYDSAGRLVLCEKLVYGEVELIHRYEYGESGALKLAEITMVDEDPQILEFETSDATE